jgi:hypothetical protein
VLAAEYDVPSLEFLPSIHHNVQITFCISISWFHE